MVRHGIPAGPAGFAAPALGVAAFAPTTAFGVPGRVLPSRTTAWQPPRPSRTAGATARTRSVGTVASGKILVAAVAAGAVVPAAQALDTSHLADAGSTSELGTGQLALAAQQGGSRPAANSAGVTSPINDVTTVSLSSAALAAAAAPAEADLDDLSKAISVARENGPLEFGTPYSAGNERTLDGQISKALGLLGLPQRLAPGVKKIIMKESTGNADAINDWDSNAARGTPSKGLMQLIDTTFANSVLPSLADRGIYDPVANITAGVRQMIANHSIEDLMDGGLTDSSGNYKGYGGAAIPDDGLGRAD